MTTFDKIKHYLKSLTRDEKKEVRRRLVHDSGGGDDNQLILNLNGCSAYVLGTVNDEKFLTFNGNKTNIEHYCYLFPIPTIDNYDPDTIVDILNFDNDQSVIDSVSIHHMVENSYPVIVEDELPYMDVYMHFDVTNFPLSLSSFIIIESETDYLDLIVTIKYTKNS